MNRRVRVNYFSIIKHVCLAIIIFFTENIHSQTLKNTVQIQGIVADSATKKPHEFVDVILLSTADSIIEYDLTKEDGSFVFKDVKPADYRIRIQGVGTNQRVFPIHVENTVDLKTIYVGSNLKTLNSVTIVGRRELVKQEADRIIYDMQADPESKGNTILGMVSKIPYLSLDGEGNILLKGSNSYKVLINGKSTGLVVNNLKDIASSIPASTIKSIEVITDPSSKYDAEGLTGIINIIMLKQTVAGYNGSVNVSARSIADAPIGPNAGVSFALQEGKFGLSLLAGGGVSNQPQTIGSLNRFTTLTKLEQADRKKSSADNAYGGLDLSYEIDSLHLITAQLSIHENRSTITERINSILFSSDTILQQYNLNNSGNTHGEGAEIGVNYQLGFKANKKQTLTFSYRFMNNFNSLFNNLDILPLKNFQQPDFRQSNKESLAENTMQVDYVQPIKEVLMESGVKAILRKNRGDFQVHNFDSTTTAFELDPLRSNLFNNNQDVFAAYNAYTYNHNKWELTGGIRLEETVIGVDYVKGNSNSRHYLNILPSASIKKELDKNQSIVVAYSNRMQRASVLQLNPFVDRSNPNVESMGNLQLHPIITNSIKVEYLRVKKSTLSVTLNYLFFTGIIDRITTYDPTRAVTTIKFENIGTVNVTRIYIYVNSPLTDQLNINFNTDLRYITAYSMIEGTRFSNNGFGASANFNASYNLKKGWRINGFFGFIAKGIGGVQTNTNGFTTSSFGLNKSFFEDKLTFSASVYNPFSRSQDHKVQLVGPYFSENSTGQFNFRSFTLSANYKFGKLKNNVKSKKNINNDDLDQ